MHTIYAIILVAAKGVGALELPLAFLGKLLKILEVDSRDLVILRSSPIRNQENLGSI